LPKLFYLIISNPAAAVIRGGFGIQPPLPKPIHLPRFAHQTAGPLVLWTFTLVMSHTLLAGFEFAPSLSKEFAHGFSATTLPFFQNDDDFACPYFRGS